MDILHKYKTEIDSFCKANKVKKLSLFGSYLKDTANTESDVDLLVEFKTDTEYGLLDIVRMERQLSEIIGRKVDLRTPEELSRYFRDAIITAFYVDGKSKKRNLTNKYANRII